MSDGQGSCSNGGIERGENMSDVRELIPELDLISVERTSLMPAEKQKHVDSVSIRKKRNFAQNVILFLACVGAGFFGGVAMAVTILIYCLQAGPI